MSHHLFSICSNFISLIIPGSGPEQLGLPSDSQSSIFGSWDSEIHPTLLQDSHLPFKPLCHGTGRYSFFCFSLFLSFLFALGWRSALVVTHGSAQGKSWPFQDLYSTTCCASSNQCVLLKDRLVLFSARLLSLQWRSLPEANMSLPKVLTCFSRNLKYRVSLTYGTSFKWATASTVNFPVIHLPSSELLSLPWLLLVRLLPLQTFFIWNITSNQF